MLRQNTPTASCVNTSTPCMRVRVRAVDEPLSIYNELQTQMQQGLRPRFMYTCLSSYIEITAGMISNSGFSIVALRYGNTSSLFERLIQDLPISFRRLKAIYDHLGVPSRTCSSMISTELNKQARPFSRRGYIRSRLCAPAPDR